MSSHVEDVTRTGGRTRICKRCKFSTANAKEFLHHQISAHAEAVEIHTCEKCEFATASLLELQRHRKVHKRSLSIRRSSSVGSEGGAKFDLEGRRLSVSTEHSVDEDDDRLVIDEEIATISHSSSTRSIGAPGVHTRTYSCNECGLSTTNAKIYLHHQVEEHGHDFIVYECDLCDYATKYKQKLPRHQKVHFQTVVRSSYQVRSPKVNSTLSPVRSPLAFVSTAAAASEEEMMMEEEEARLLPPRQQSPAPVAENKQEDLRMNASITENEELDIPEGVLVIQPEAPEDAKPIEAPPKPAPKLPKLAKVVVASPSSAEKPKRIAPIRQEVDPWKYVQVRDEEGVKYACSKCGNVYKWRKSLNKHWKEKHDGEPPPTTIATPLKVPKVSLSSSAMKGDSMTSLSIPKYSAEQMSVLGGSRQQVYMPIQPKPMQQDRYGRGSGGKGQQPVSMSPSSRLSGLTSSSMGGSRRPFSSSPMMATFSKVVDLTKSSSSPSPGMDSSASSLHAEGDSVLDLSVRQPGEMVENYSALHNTSGNGPESSQDEPLDFSMKAGNEMREIKKEMGAYFDGYDFAYSSGDERASPSSLQCTKCAYTAKHPLEFSRHMELHLSKRFHKCAECQENFSTTEELNSHFAAVHQEMIQDTDLVKFNGNSPQVSPAEGIEVNVSVGGSEEKHYKCSKCEYTARWPTELQKHAAVHSGERPYVCMVCASSYKWKWDLVKHFEKSHHSIPNPYKKREYSPHTSSISGDFSRDFALKDQPLAKKRKLPEPTFRCNQCTFIGKWPSELQRHLLVHSDVRPHTCHLCGYSTKWKGDLGVHLRKYHSGAEIPSEKSGKDSDNDFESSHDEAGGSSSQPVFPGPEPLSVHIPTVGSGAPNGATSSSSSAETAGSSQMSPQQGRPEDYGMEGMYTSPSDRLGAKHLPVAQEVSSALQTKIMARTMSGGTMVLNTIDTKKPLPKLSPNSAASSLISPNKGTSSAEILLPYKCSVCEYRARWPSEITQHMKNHSDEKPYHCPRCTYKSKWKWDVVKHLKRCGGGTIKDVIDTTKRKFAPPNVSVIPSSKSSLQALQVQVSSGGGGPPNVTVVSVAPMQASPHSSANLSPGMSASKGNGSSAPDEWSGGMNLSMGSSGEAHQSKPRQPVYRGIINQGQHHCLECPFIGHSPAELKRHTILHSDIKPYSCATCGYSSKWKCDLKKHVRTYNHVAAPRGSSSSSRSLPTMVPATSSSSGSFVYNASLSPSESEDSMDQESSASPFSKGELYKCDQCQYVTYKKNFLETHIKIHSTHGGKAPLPAKYKCKQCEFHAEDLSSFLQHKLTHSSQQSGEAVASVSPDRGTGDDNSNPPILGISRHRRKPVKQFRCQKCPYVCFKKAGLELHEAMHEPRGDDAFICPYCNYNVYSKSLLTQHMRLHPEYHQEQLQSEGSDVNSVVSPSPQMSSSDGESNAGEPPQLIGDYNSNAMNLSTRSEDCGYPLPTEAAKKEAAAAAAAPVAVKPKFRFMCEWCDYGTNFLNQLCKHAQSQHPVEMAKQEAEEQNQEAAEEMINMSSSLPQQPQNSSGEEHRADIGNGQASPKQELDEPNSKTEEPDNNNTTKPVDPTPEVKVCPTATVKPTVKPTVVQVMTVLPEDNSPMRHIGLPMRKRKKMHTCDKCNYFTENINNLQRHRDHHGYQGKHKCEYCDYSLDRLNLLFQHMKGVHGASLDYTQFKASMGYSDNIPIGEHTTAMDSIENQLLDGTAETLEHDYDPDGSSVADFDDASEVDFDASEAVGEMDDEESVGMETDQELDSRTDDIEWQQVKLKGKTMYMYLTGVTGKKRIFKCTKCEYTTSNVTNCSKHMNHHGGSGRYCCKYCDYCVDGIKHVTHHMTHSHKDKQHPGMGMQGGNNSSTVPEDPDEFEEELSAQVPRSTPSRKSPIHATSPTSGKKFYYCTRCPYKVHSREAIHRHMEMHEYWGKFTCNHCDYSVDRVNLLYQHLRVHQKKPGRKTGRLGFKNISPSDFRQKGAAHESTEKISPGKRGPRIKIRYKCARCPYATFCKGNLVKHRRLHLVRSKYRCHVCNYSANRWFLLQKHLKIHDDDESLLEQSLNESNFQDVYLEGDHKNKPTKGSDDMDKPAGESGEENSDDGDSVEKGSVLNCSECPYSSNSSTVLSKHARLHRSEQKYHCDYCSYSYDHMTLLLQHRKLHSNDDPNFDANPPESRLLNKFLPQINNMQEIKSDTETENQSTSADKQEVRVSTGRGRFHCKICPYRCTSSKHQRAHNKLHGVARKFICDYCNWSCDRHNLLFQHRRVHSATPGFVVRTDRKAFLNSACIRNDSNLIQEDSTENRSNQHSQEKRASPTVKLGTKMRRMKLYSCKQCPFSCDNKQSFAYHNGLHSSQGKYKCDMCTYSVCRQNLLLQHQKLHESTHVAPPVFAPKKRMKCPKCPYHCVSRALLDSHVKMHASGKKHTCQFCDYSTNRFNLLQQHMKVHVDDVVAEGQEPGNSGAIASSKSSTASTKDSNIPVFKCERCPFRAVSKSHYESHKSQHSANKKLKCPFCDYSSARKDLILQHVKLHFPSQEIDHDSVSAMISNSDTATGEKNKDTTPTTPSTDPSTVEAPASTEADHSPEEPEPSDEPAGDVEMENDDGSSNEMEENGDQLFICEYCDRSFPDSESCKNHERQHLIGIMYCNRTGKTLTNMD